MKHELEAALVTAIKDLFGVETSVELTRPAEQFGDFTTNIALQLAGKLQKNPREIAEQLAEHFRDKLREQVSAVSVAGPGFLNLKVADAALLNSSSRAAGYRSDAYQNKVVVAEYSDPNPFKVLHAGHLYTSVVGDAIANLLEHAGGQVHRVNFGGDVGLHVAKSMWAIVKNLGGELPEKLNGVAADQRAEWLSERYVEGNEAYEHNETAKSEIVGLNKRIYQVVNDNDHDAPFAQIYWTCRQWSYDYFNQFYARIGTKFEKYYPESEVAPLGLQTVKEHVGSVFAESEGAIVFKGETSNLHTRVFINSAGLPTYEAKDVGLIMKKWQDYHFDVSVVITGNDIVAYMQVVLKAVEQIQPELAIATIHLTHGIVKLKGGKKMSSRKGNILRAVDVLDTAAQANLELTGQDNDSTTLGAVKYAFLKNRIGGDILYDPTESVSLTGNSGPYLQYAYARARSILNKAGELEGNQPGGLETAERSLVRKLSEYPEIVDKAVAELMPHHICTYLYELAQTFNSFYEHNRVIGDTRQNLRLVLVDRYADVLKSGLEILNISAPEHL